MIHLVLAKNFADFTRYVDEHTTDLSQSDFRAYQFVDNVNALRDWDRAIVHKVAGYTENPHYDDYFYDVLHAQEKMWRLKRNDPYNRRSTVPS